MVQVTDKDIVLLGHGSYPGGADNTKLPDDIDFYILPPVGYTLMTDVAEAMIKQREIPLIVLHHATGGTTPVEPPVAVYRAGQLAPDVTLYDLGSLAAWGERTIGSKKNVVTTSVQIKLSALIQDNDKIAAFREALPVGEKLKIYWSACASQVSGNSASLT